MSNFDITSNPKYSEFIALSRYARWLPSKTRRETWGETVTRYLRSYQDSIDESTYADLYQAIIGLHVMPSMRAMMTAGPALERDHVAGYNCAYTAIDSTRAFDEIMYILLCGTGVGFSCEREEVNSLPAVSEEMHKTETVIVVSDSKVGWASAFRELIAMLYAGKVPHWDVSRVRPAGAPLKTFGGRASGPEPLAQLFAYTVALFKGAAGRRLTTLEVHGLVCKIGEIVVVGGVRRAALISLSNFGDDRLRNAKSGQWWNAHPEYALANNSIAYTEKPDAEAFIREWLALIESKSGERGIFNRAACERIVLDSGLREGGWKWGTNPCSEIILRPKQFCNLSEIVVRATDTEEMLHEKARLATILGTLQATKTNFRYLTKAWRNNTEEERLLGVSMTGIMDNPLTNGKKGDLPGLLQRLKGTVEETNRLWARMLGIPTSAAMTCVKPSGTVSQLVDSASGIHARYSDYYMRTIRADIKDPLCQLMIDQGFPHEPCAMKPDTTMIFSFPMHSPKQSIKRNDMGAIEQLEMWLTYQTNWCHHKPSITVFVRENEWLTVGAWVYEHFDYMSGVSFLPHSDHTYQQAPYQELTKEEYKEALKLMPKDSDWSRIDKYELQDHTAGSQTLACTGSVCELVDLEGT